MNKKTSFDIFNIDFILNDVCSTHMQDLQEVTQEVHYENFRAEKLAGGGSVPKKSRYNSGSRSAIHCRLLI